MRLQVMYYFFLSIILLFSGCTGNSLSNAQPDKALPSNSSSKVEFKTSDGYIIKGNLYKPSLKTKDAKKPVVLLLHMLGRTKDTYNPLVPKLIENGYYVLAIDFRGHGESTSLVDGTKKSYQSFSDSDWRKITNDIDAALVFLSSQGSSIDINKCAVVGASIGANSAIITAANHTDAIKVVVALSPGMDFRSLQPGNYITKAKAPILLVAAKDDGYSADSVSQLNNMAKSLSTVEIYQSGGHGTNLFSSHPELLEQIVSWIKLKMPSN